MRVTWLIAFCCAAVTAAGSTSKDANLNASELETLRAMIALEGLKPAWIESVRSFEFGGLELVTALVFPEPSETSAGVCRGKEIAFGLENGKWTRIGEPQSFAVVTRHDACSAARKPGKRIVLRSSVSDGDLRAIIRAIRKGRRAHSDPEPIVLPDGTMSMAASIQFPPLETKAVIGSVLLDRDCATVITSRRSGAGQELNLCKLHGTWTIVGVEDWVA